jgi:hypothetical protein
LSKIPQKSKQNKDAGATYCFSIKHPKERSQSREKGRLPEDGGTAATAVVGREIGVRKGDTRVRERNKVFFVFFNFFFSLSYRLLGMG